MRILAIVLLVVVVVLFVWAGLGCVQLIETTDTSLPAVALMVLILFYLIIQGYILYMLTTKSEKPLSP